MLQRNPLQTYRRLVWMTNQLLMLSTERRVLGPLVLSQHLPDILAPLVQLSCAPLMKPKEDDEKEEMSDGKFVMTKEKYETLSKDQEDFKAKLNALLDRVYQPSVVRSLLILQAGGNKEQKVRSTKKFFFLHMDI